MEIRRANIWEAKEITNLWEKMMKEVGEEVTEEMRTNFFLTTIDRVSSPEHIVLVATEKDKLVGFINGYFKLKEYSSSRIVGECEALFVLPEHRDSTIGGRLVEELTQIFNKSKVEELRFVTTYKEELIGSWDKKGYKPVRIVFSKGGN